MIDIYGRSNIVINCCKILFTIRYLIMILTYTIICIYCTLWIRQLIGLNNDMRQLKTVKQHFKIPFLIILIVVFLTNVVENLH